MIELEQTNGNIDEVQFYKAIKRMEQDIDWKQLLLDDKIPEEAMVKYRQYLKVEWLQTIKTKHIKWLLSVVDDGVPLKDNPDFQNKIFTQFIKNIAFEDVAFEDMDRLIDYKKMDDIHFLEMLSVFVISLEHQTFIKRIESLSAEMGDKEVSKILKIHNDDILAFVLENSKYYKNINILLDKFQYTIKKSKININLINQPIKVNHIIRNQNIIKSILQCVVDYDLSDTKLKYLLGNITKKDYEDLFPIGTSIMQKLEFMQLKKKYLEYIKN